MFDATTLVGTAAAVASTASFAPQAWKVIKTRETKGISTGMYILTVVGFALWFGYGIMLGKWPLIVPNGLCLLLSAFILLMKVLPSAQRDAVADTLDVTEPAKADRG
jgi:MtN3 and saliva related transmembrane protein